ncbi:transposase [Rhizobium sp. SG741]|uniref:transposase n=1 Tax=Rhizobium sp. SG741 TaxID=2587114 RepID=UPI001445F3D7|nr:transposase [Rhizobium sp. SG741]NKJ09967.1 transposase [Rhizobium sp. SG741]
MSDTVNQTRAFEVLTATPIATRRKPRDWPDDEKARLVAATLQPGANVSAIARGAGLDPSQLYDWRRKAIASGSIAPLSKSVDAQVRFAQVEAVAGSAVEIVIGDAVVRVGGDVATERLVKILRAVRQA